MKRTLHSLKVHPSVQFNLTPMIDVVFILITFFMLICRSIGQENYKLLIPDRCTHAVTPDQPDRNAITVSVVPKSQPGGRQVGDADETDAVIYAVRAREYDPQAEPYRADEQLLLDDMTKQIAAEAERKGDSLVYLRADRNITYGHVQNALLALSRAKIKTVHLAAYRRQEAKSK